MSELPGKPIAYGRTAEIYAWQGGQVLKLYYDWFDLENIQYEFEIARAIQASGLPVPRVGEIIQVNGRNGLVYQRIDGVTMLKNVARKPWNILRYARRMAELHFAMHTCAIQAHLPSQRQKLGKKIQQAQAIPDQLREKSRGCTGRHAQPQQLVSRRFSSGEHFNDRAG